MVINGEALEFYKPVIPFVSQKIKHSSGTSYGLGEAGYDIRIKQDILFRDNMVYVGNTLVGTPGNFTLASSIEKFRMPNHLVAIVHDKSTWARQGLSVFNTVIEPGWEGFLTLELIYHGKKDLLIPSGSGIAQVIFHRIAIPASYDGKYQNQPDKPVESIWQRS